MFSHEEAMVPILRLLADGTPRRRRQICESMADHFGLSQQEREAMLPSSADQVYRSRTSWGLTFLRQAGLIERPSRGVYAITDEGKSLLDRGVDRLDTSQLADLSPRFAEWVHSSRERSSQGGTGGDAPAADTAVAGRSAAGEPLTPEESLAKSHAQLQSELASEILDAIRQCSPRFFEDLVVRLLVAMGYGGSFADAARSVGRSGDGGIDGIVKEDRLGLDAIYLQAKRIQGSVGRPTVQAFVGAITGHRATKGVFVTTGTFTREAKEYTANLDKTVVLVDGGRLAELMIEYGLGVTLEQTYEIKRLDSDFFED